MATPLDRALTGHDIAERALQGLEERFDFSMAPEDYEAGVLESLVALRWCGIRYAVDFEALSRAAASIHEAETEACGGQELDWSSEIRNERVISS